MNPDAEHHPGKAWSEEKPKRRGWWWVELSTGDKMPLYVNTAVSGISGLHVEFNRRLYRLGAQLFRRWAGPLSEPLEPSDERASPNDKDQVRRDSAPPKPPATPVASAGSATDEELSMLRRLAAEVVEMGKTGSLPDGDVVMVSMLLWAEDWWAKLEPESCPYARGKSPNAKVSHDAVTGASAATEGNKLL